MIQRNLAIVVLGIAWVAAGCGGTPAPKTITATPDSTDDIEDSVETTDSPSADTASPTDEDAMPQDSLEALVQRDAPKAKAILESTLSSKDKTRAVWAAVYIRLLHVDIDSAAVERKLVIGAAGSDDLLLKTLCWRWLAVSSPHKLPAVKKIGDDPVTQIFAAIAYAGQNKSPKPLQNALQLGKATLTEPDKIPLNTLLRQSAPYDNGALAVAIAFVSARRMELATQVEGVTVPVSAQHRRQLLQLLGADSFTPTDTPDAPFAFSGTTLHQRIEDTMQGQPLEMIRKACVHSQKSLQLSAVRALAIQATTPVAGDLAAAAAAMNSTEPTIQLEAARTYLLLVARSTTE